MKTNPLEKMKKRSPRTRFFWCYTLGFLLCAAGCYCWFLIKGKTLIVTKGTTAESYFEKNEPDVKLQKYDQYADAYNALLDGRGDAFSTDNTEVLAWAKSNKGFKVGITHLGDDDTIAPAVQKGNTELLNFVNDEIVKLGKDNFFHKDYEETLVDTYGLDYEDELVVEGGETNA